MAHAQAGIRKPEAPNSTGAENVSELTDRQLLTRYVGQRDEAAFAGLLERHARIVWRVCRRVLGQQQDVEDAFQAVFLVLAQSAASIRNSDAVGSWLHGVAFRTAMNARRIALRRQKGEKGAAAPIAEPSPPSQAACRELQRQLDEELQRLAEIYRAPFILCCLEGMSKSEAAQDLGCKEGTVSGRLARARKILQKRLARRGITLAGVLTAAALIPNTGAAAVPASLVHTTVGAVLATDPEGSLSPTVRALAESALPQPALTRKLLSVLVFAGLFLLLGGGSLAVSLLPSHKDVAPTAIEPDTFIAPGVPLGTPMDEGVAAVAFSPDGRRLVTAGGKSQIPGQIKIWDVNRARELAAVRKIPGVRTVAFSPGGKSFAAADAGGALALRDAETADELASVAAHPGGVQGLAFSKDGSLLATGGADGMVRLWSGDRLKQVRAWRGHAGRIAAVAFFGNGQAIVTASEDKSAKICDVQTGDVKCTLEGHQDALEAVAVSPDDRLVATAGRDGTVRLWDAATGAAVFEERGGRGEGLEKMKLSRPSPLAPRPYYAVAFSPDGTLLAGAGPDGAVQLWDAKTFQPAGTLEQHAAPIWALAFSRDGVLASGSADRTVKLWRLKGPNPPIDLSTSWSGIRPILAAAYAPDGAVLAVATTDSTIHIRDAKSGDVLRVLSGHTDHVTCLAFSRDGKTLASGSKDRTVNLWDPATGEIRQTLAGHAEAVQAMTFIPGGARLASAGADGAIRLWDVRSGRELAMQEGHKGPIAALACAPDGGILASGGADRTIKLWDLKSGESRPAARSSLKCEGGAIRTLAFSEEGVLASGGDDGVIRLWDPGKETTTATLQGHVGPVLALAFTPRGRTLVSAGHDHSVRVWENTTGEPRGALAGHKDVVTALAIHPHGRDLVSGSFDTRLLRWKATVMRPRDVRPAPEPRRADNLVALQDAPPQQPREPAEKEKAANKEKKEAGKNDKPQLKVDLYEDFRGARSPSPVFRMMGIDQGATMKPEAGGLRITVPANQARRHRAGIEMRTPVKGDFEITAGYEILAADQPDAGYGVGFEVYVNTATPTQDRLGIFRLNRPLEGESYMVGRGKTENGKSEHKNTCYPTTARSGQLRLTRRGVEATAWAAEGAAGPFREIQQTELGAADVSRLWFAAYLGNIEHAVDVRIVDVRIRSELPDNDPVIAPAIAPAIAADVDVPAPVQSGPRVSLILVGVLGLTVAAALLLGVGIAVARRWRSQSLPGKPKSHGKQG
jgi:RNA polymerase sigma factor (sigma-70 family)